MRLRRLHLVPLLAGVIAAFNTGLAAQEAKGARSRPISESAERLARELWPTDVSSQLEDDGRPRFRASVVVHLTPLPAPWTETASIPPRQRGTLYHREFLSSVTPQAFRASTTQPVAGVSVDPGTMLDPVKRAWREWQTRRVRTRIDRELEALRGAGAAE